MGVRMSGSMAAAARERAPPSATYTVTPASPEVCHCLRVGGDAARLGTSAEAVRSAVIVISPPWLSRPDSDSGLNLSLDLVVDVHVHGRSDPERERDGEIHLFPSQAAGLL